MPAPSNIRSKPLISDLVLIVPVPVSAFRGTARQPVVSVPPFGPKLIELVELETEVVPVTDTAAPLEMFSVPLPELPT